MTVIIFPVQSPIVAEELLSAPAGGWPADVMDCGHATASYETYLRISDLSGAVLRFCSSCMLQIWGGRIRVIAP